MAEHRIELANTRKQDLYLLPREHFFGTDPDGHELGFNNYYMLRDGRPFFAVSGECHYSRVHENQWEDTIRKMKAGGINVIATYVFWNHHEEKEGEFRFDGRRNIRKFVELCGRYGMYVILRIGPFDHGEVRNGGLPDWLYGKPFEVRSDNEGFLAYTKILYEKISEQICGLFYQDGGPIIGVQIENEYMHSAAPWEMTTGISNEWIPGGADGIGYMRKLRQLAVEAGIRPVFFTCTGWGGAATPAEEMMPLWGGYAFWPWMFVGEGYVHPATPEYLYRDNHNSAVRSTYNFSPAYDPESRPYACCEMGGGMMATYNYRFRLPYESVDAMANIKLGSGCNFPGYYMYRGGSNPIGACGTYMNEGQCPKISYDYQAPLGEFGQARPSFFRLRTIHLFTKHFGERLCNLVTSLPEDSQTIDPADQGPLRYAVRTDGERGFVFINNFQDHAVCEDKTGETITLGLETETIRMENISLAAGENAILPFNMDIEGTTLRYATAQPLSVWRNGDALTYVFFVPEGMEGRFVFEDGEVFTARSDKMCGAFGQAAVGAEGGFVFEGGDVRHFEFFKECARGLVHFAVLTRQESLQYTEIERNGEMIAFLSENTVTDDGEALYVETVSQESRDVPVKLCGKNRYILTMPELDETAKDTMLEITYSGDIGHLFDMAGALVSDNFSNEAVWETGLKEIGAGSGRQYTLYITPRKENVIVDVSSTMAGRAEKSEGAYAELFSVRIREVREKVIPLAGTRAEMARALRECGCLPIAGTSIRPPVTLQKNTCYL